MIGNFINYDKKYENSKNIWGKYFLDNSLKQYLNLITGKEVLDLGIGEGNNSILLHKLGYSITGVDSSLKALKVCEQQCKDIFLVNSDIRLFHIEKDYYDLITSRFVLQFIHKNDAISIINDIKNKVKNNGLVYISVFSLNDNSINLTKNNVDFDELPNNIFYNKTKNTYHSFYSKDEVLEYFKGFKTILISEEYFLDQSHGSPHYHGIIKYIGQKL